MLYYYRDEKGAIKKGTKIGAAKGYFGVCAFVGFSV
jgi:hypothetical protein